MRDVLGFIAGGLILLSGAAHSFVGWPVIRAEIAKTNTPADLVTGIAAGWYFGGAAMLIIGVTVVLQFVEVRRNPSASLRATQVAGLVYLAFGFGVLAIARAVRRAVHRARPGARCGVMGTPLDPSALGDRMVPVTSLWLPIVLSAVFMPSPARDPHGARIPRERLAPLPNETGVQDALRPFNLARRLRPAQAGSAAAMSDPAFIEKRQKGPVAFITVIPSGASSMGAMLGIWVVYSLIVSGCAAYVAGRALGVGATYPQVFRFAGTAAFLAYSMSLPQNSIWWGRNWGMTLKSMFDGLIYGALVGGTFGWLWPR